MFCNQGDDEMESNGNGSLSMDVSDNEFINFNNYLDFSMEENGNVLVHVDVHEGSHPGSFQTQTTPTNLMDFQRKHFLFECSAEVFL